MSENDVIVSEQSSDLEETPEVEANASDAGVDAAAENAHDVSEAAGDEGDAAGASEAAGDEGDAAGASRASAGRGRGARRSLLEREGEVAADFLETLLDIADLDGDIDLDVDGDRAVVAVVDSEEGRVPRRLVGPNGRVLEALQELTRLAVQSATGERSRLMLDVAGFRAERRAALVAQARTAIEKCRTDGSAVELEPMSAFERKVVHDEVLAAGLVSESSGVEPRRYVVVLPAG
ncbi:MAG: R3H domain-containing nucleic acid-binding protein [Dermatophilaceae bacterium]